MRGKLMKKFVDFHVIQTVPPSCINRDDSNSPKTAVYGGVRRARISSQCWKNAMRKNFREYFDEAQLGIRTKKIVDLVAGEIIKIDPAKTGAPAIKLAEEIITRAGINLMEPKLKGKDKDGEEKAKEPGALFFMSKWQAKNLAELAIVGGADKKTAQNALVKGKGIDIALFGRMVADDYTLKVDACSQVAHSISTHRVDNDFDFFTAIDDITQKDQPVAGMLGTIEFNSSTLYRYATIAVHELHNNLAEAGITLKAVAGFARAFIMSMPTGKKNTFANNVLPDAVMVTIRGDQPVSFVGAFEEPVKLADKGGYKLPSIKKLEDYALSVYSDFVKVPEMAFSIGTDFKRLAEISPVKKVCADELYELLTSIKL